MHEFKTNWISDAQIEVEDIDEGHVWTFTFALENGERIISAAAHQRSSDHVRATHVSARARRYAERQAMLAGKIDTETAQ